MVCYTKSVSLRTVDEVIPLGSLPLWSFEHSGLITLCPCLDALISSCCTTRLGESKLMWYKYERITYWDVYQAALIRRRTSKHACMSSYYIYECGLVHEMLKSARYHIDRAEIVVLPQKIALTACFIQEESSFIRWLTNFESGLLNTTISAHPCRHAQSVMGPECLKRLQGKWALHYR